jgi:hypothetical protein
MSVKTDGLAEWWEVRRLLRMIVTKDVIAEDHHPPSQIRASVTLALPTAGN